MFYISGSSKWKQGGSLTSKMPTKTGRPTPVLALEQFPGEMAVCVAVVWGAQHKGEDRSDHLPVGTVCP